MNIFFMHVVDYNQITPHCCLAIKNNTKFYWSKNFLWFFWPNVCGNG